MERIAFYPACASDFSVPAIVLAELADQIIFCDHIARDKEAFDAAKAFSKSIVLTYIQGDEHQILGQLPRIDVVFHRQDSIDGSGITVLRKTFLARTLAKMPRDSGGIFLTDYCLLWGNEVRRLRRPAGISRYRGWNLIQSENQPFETDHGLWVVEARPVAISRELFSV